MFGEVKLSEADCTAVWENAKRGRLIKWSIMRIFNEAEPP